MGAIGLNPIRLDRIGLDPIRINAIKLGVPGAASGTDRPYIDPEVLASLKAVCICYGKSNDDPDRAIVKNLVDPDNPFVISNAAFKLNSGFGKYEVDFTVYNNQNVLVSPNKIVSIAGREFISLLPYTELSKTISSYKIKVTGLIGELSYWYRNQDGSESRIIITKDGIYQLSTCYNVENGQGSSVGFNGYSESSCTIEQIPSFEGAFVTDGIDDLITSTKTVQEMLGGSNEITVVSMIHQIDGNVNYTNGYTNYIRHGGGFIRNSVSGINGKGFNKTGIYGYTSTQLDSSNMGLGNVINNILGDKDDYSFERSSTYTLDDAKYSVQNFVNANNQPSNEGSSVAWYWTIIVNKVLTTDQINQVIAYFNLDRTLNPDILCNTIKQGITNENHAEFGDKLIDFSGNGRDIQLNNLAWDGDSGIGKYEVDFLDSSIWNSSNSTITSSKIDCKNAISHIMLLYYSVGSKEYPDIPSFKVIKTGADIDYSYIDETGSPKSVRIVDGVNVLPASHNTLYSGSGRFCGFGNPGMGNSVTITQIPSHAGALCLDGVNDFGKVTGMPIYKDYTFIAEREFLSTPDDFVNAGSIVSKAYEAGKGSFIFETFTKTQAREVSFSSTTDFDNPNTERIISYQSKYSYNGKALTAGQVEDRDVMWLGTIHDNDTRFINAAIYSLMSFPYSMSEFLIERQLKKHKLGTLYPDMVEFRPIIKHDDRITAIRYYHIKGSSWINLKPGDYIPVGSKISITTNLKSPYTIANVMSSSLTDIKVVPSAGGGNAYDILGYVTDKSPQKITMDIQVDTNLIQWNPIITSTAELTTAPTFAIRGTSTLLKAGDWIPKNSEIWVIVTMNNLIDELRKFSFNGTFIHIPSSSYNPDTGKYGFPFVIDNESPQNINLTIDEYIRYEDIVQPYPVLLRFNDENGNEVSWGGKFRVGSTITRIGSISDPESNLLNGLYSVSGLSLNGKAVTSSTSIVEKQMVFRTTATWLLDNNEPKVILSPSRLRIPNSSYKLLGYIPDISGHGNHGIINNSAYAEGSGVNADGSYQLDGVDDFITIPTTVGGKQMLMKVNWQNDYDAPGYMYDSNTGEYRNYIIKENKEQIAYENASKTYIDGILNANLTSGDLKDITHNITSQFNNASGIPYIGCRYSLENFLKMSLYDFMLFDNISTGDKIKELNEYVGIEAKVELPPYYWDAYGKTNLDEDKNYIANLGTVKDVIETGYPYTFADADAWWGSDAHYTVIDDYTARLTPSSSGGSSELYFGYRGNIPLKVKITSTETYSLLYHASEDIRFNVIANEPLITELPYGTFEIIGLGNDSYITIELLPTETSTLYGLSNINFAYNKMSGFGGYSLGRFDNSWASSSSNNTSVIVVLRNPYDITLKKLGGNSDWEFNNTELKVISNPVSVKFKPNKNIRFTCDYHYYPVGGNSEGTPLGITSKDLIANEDTVITIPPISQENIDKYNIDINRGYYLVYFQLSSTLAVNEEVTIEMLPLYPNGLVYDGVEDYSKNENIPAFTDFTYILKRELLTNTVDTCSVFKGTKYAAGGWAFIADYYNSDSKTTGYSFGNAVSYTTNEKTIYGTKTSVNGNTIVPGPNVDELGITLGKWSSANYKKMVFYKLMLYPKTIPLLQINFLKNLMEKDEIIDLNNKIFIQE